MRLIEICMMHFRLRLARWSIHASSFALLGKWLYGI